MRSKGKIGSLLLTAAAAAFAVSAALAAKPHMKSIGGMMEAHTGAKLTVLAPANGAVITANTVTTKIAVSRFMLDTSLAGTPNKPGVGHYHIMLDGSLINMYGTPTATISLQNVAAGPHKLTFAPAENDHADDMTAAKTVSFTYRPAQPLPAIGPAKFPGKPSVTIVSPKSGSTVSGSFVMTVAVNNFHLSAPLFGKADVPGYGHWHVNLDSTTQGMMGMATMMGMSGTPTFTVSLKGVTPGRHRFWAILEDNTHAPTIGAQTSVTLNVQ
jgi:hypothetical protein